uniref:ARAD1C22242p n=1 Tax=Blastobotrys adeninivorans TaxID=409370 RepID=A0A060T6R2_BLAAD
MPSDVESQKVTGARRPYSWFILYVVSGIIQAALTRWCLHAVPYDVTMVQQSLVCLVLGAALMYYQGHWGVPTLDQAKISVGVSLLWWLSLAASVLASAFEGVTVIYWHGASMLLLPMIFVFFSKSRAIAPAVVQIVVSALTGALAIYKSDSIDVAPDLPLVMNFIAVGLQAARVWSAEMALKTMAPVTLLTYCSLPLLAITLIAGNTTEILQSGHLWDLRGLLLQAGVFACLLVQMHSLSHVGFIWALVGQSVRQLLWAVWVNFSILT